MIRFSDSFYCLLVLLDSGLLFVLLDSGVLIMLFGSFLFWIPWFLDSLSCFCFFSPYKVFLMDYLTRKAAYARAAGLLM